MSKFQPYELPTSVRSFYFNHLLSGKTINIAGNRDGDKITIKLEDGEVHKWAFVGKPGEGSWQKQ